MHELSFSQMSKILESTNLRTSVITFTLSCANNCFRNSYNDGLTMAVTSCCTTDNCNTYQVTSVVQPTVDSCFIGFGGNMGSSSGFYPSEIISCGTTNAHYCIVIFELN